MFVPASTELDRRSSAVGADWLASVGPNTGDSTSRVDKGVLWTMLGAERGTRIP
jgi:hypothetical protein